MLLDCKVLLVIHLTSQEYANLRPHLMPVDDANRITIRLAEYIAYTTALSWVDGSLEISNLGIGNPGDKFFAIGLDKLLWPDKWPQRYYICILGLR